MSPITENVHWGVLLDKVTEHAEKEMGLALVVDADVVEEVAHCANKTVESFNKDHPNLAKIAGSVVFWIRRLKPVTHDPASRQKYLAINEWIALRVGIAICGLYSDDSAKFDCVRISERVFTDWATSLRKNAHSPHGIVMAFEVMVSDLSH